MTVFIWLWATWMTLIVLIGAGKIDDLRKRVRCLETKKEIEPLNDWKDL